MSRSYRKNPEYHYITMNSASKDKRLTNRLHRAKAKQIIRSCGNDVELLENTVFPLLDEVYDVWAWGVDGPKYFDHTLHFARSHTWEEVAEMMSHKYTWWNIGRWKGDYFRNWWTWKMYTK